MWYEVDFRLNTGFAHDFLYFGVSVNSQMHEVPYFFEPFILNMHEKYDITVEKRQLAFNYYGMRDPERGNDGKKKMTVCSFWGNHW